MNKRLLCAGCLTVWGVLLFIGGWVANYAILRTVKNSINSAVQYPTDTNSDSFKDFVDDYRPDTATAFYNYYFFNTTNVEDVVVNGALPILQEVGPFVYRAYSKKYPSTSSSEVGVSFNADKSRVTYLEWKNFEFQPSLSVDAITGASLTENTPVVVPNPYYDAVLGQTGVDYNEENLLANVMVITKKLFNGLKGQTTAANILPTTVTEADLRTQFYNGTNSQVSDSLQTPGYLGTLLAYGTAKSLKKGSVSSSGTLPAALVTAGSRNPLVPLEYYYWAKHCLSTTAVGNVIVNHFKDEATFPCDFTTTSASFPVCGSISQADWEVLLTDSTYGLWNDTTSAGGIVQVITAYTAAALASEGPTGTTGGTYLQSKFTGLSSNLNLVPQCIFAYVATFGMAYLHQAFDNAGDYKAPLDSNNKIIVGSRRWRNRAARDIIYSKTNDEFVAAFASLAAPVGLLRDDDDTLAEAQARFPPNLFEINTGGVTLGDVDRVYKYGGISTLVQQPNPSKPDGSHFWCGGGFKIEDTKALYTPQGTPGEVSGLRFKPSVGQDTILPLWNSNIQRSVEFSYEKDDTVKGVPVYRYRIADYMLDPAKTRVVDPNPLTNRQLFNMSYKGLVDMKCLQQGAPITVSQPRFYGVDATFTSLAKLPSMKAIDPDNYVFIQVEPNSGATIRGHLALQMMTTIAVNPQLYPAYNCSKNTYNFYACAHDYSGLPKPSSITFNPAKFYNHPFFYVRKVVELTDDQASKLKSTLLRALDASLIILVVLTIVGGVLAITGLILLVQTRRQGKSSSSDGMRLD